MTPLYYESHITIEPVFDERLVLLKQICENNGFHVAKLLLQRRAEDTAERSSKDTFCTAHDMSYDRILERMTHTQIALERAGFAVWRMKIESVIFDLRIKE
jgi:hypothetical protein